MLTDEKFKAMQTEGFVFFHQRQCWRKRMEARPAYNSFTNRTTAKENMRTG